MSGRIHGVGPNPPGDGPGWAPHHEDDGAIDPQVLPSLCPTPPGKNSSCLSEHAVCAFIMKNELCRVEKQVVFTSPSTFTSAPGPEENPSGTHHDASSLALIRATHCSSTVVCITKDSRIESIGGQWPIYKDIILLFLFI